MRLALKALAIGIFLVLGSSSAYSQCSGNPPAGRLCGNNTASPTLPGWQTMTSMLDRNFGAPSIQGTILNRGASLWSATASPILGANGGNSGAIVLEGSSTGSATIGVKAAAGSVTFNLPITNGTLNQVLITDGSGNTSWTTAGAGTVSSVALALPSSILTVSGSPVTGTGTLTGTLATQTANFVWAGPTTGSAATPTFRALVGADLPNPSASTLGGVESFAAVGSQWIRQISTSGVPTASQPAFTDISGTLSTTQCPTPTLSAIGCVEAINAVTSNWIRSISTAGVPALSQPNFTDLVGNATLGQLPSISNNSVLGNNSGGTAVPSALTGTNILDFIASTQGDVLYRNATTWVALAPGTNGQVLTTAGAAANPTWTTVTGTGTVTSVATNNGLTGGPITTTGTIGLATITTGTVLANITGGSAIPIANTPSSILDIIGSATGDILYRSSGSGWQVLAPGTNGQVLTQGATTPSWTNAGTLTNVTIAAGAGIGVSGTCNITTSGTGTVATAAGVAANILRSVTSGPDTIVNTDCNKTVQEGTGSSGSWTVTLPSISGFSGTCVVIVKNGDTARGKILSGFPADMYTTLWPSQIVKVGIVNGAWATLLNPGVWQTTSNIQFFIDNGGSDTTNDGLAAGSAGAFATLQHCANVAAQHVYAVGGIQCSHTASQTDSEFVSVFYPNNGGGTLVFNSATAGTQFAWDCLSADYCLEFGDNALVGLKDITFLASTTSPGIILGHNYGVLDMNQNVALTGQSSGTSLIACDYDTHFNVNNGFAYAGTVQFLFSGCQGSRWNINGTITATSSPTVGRLFNFAAGSLASIQGNVTWAGSATVSVGLVSGNSVLNNASGTLPGGAPSPTTGGQYCTSAC
jgi:hypothetical protein